MRKIVILLVVIITLNISCFVYADTSTGSSDGSIFSGLLAPIIDLPNKMIEPIKNAIYDSFKHWASEMYINIIDNCLNETLSIIPVSLKDTPNLWSESSPTVVNVITDGLKPICITLATIGFIVNLSKVLGGSVSYGKTAWRCFIRLAVTIILIGYSGRFLQWIINFNDSFIQFIDARISTDIITTIRSTIIDRSFVESTVATLSTIIMVQLTGWIIWIASLCVQFMLIFRLIQIMFYMLISPLVFTCNITEETSDIIKNYIRKFIAVVIKSFFYNLVFIAYITCLTLPDAIPLGIFARAMCIMVLIFSLFRIPKEFEELLGVGKQSNFSLSSLVTAIGSVIALV